MSQSVTAISGAAGQRGALAAFIAGLLVGAVAVAPVLQRVTSGITVGPVALGPSGILLAGSVAVLVLTVFGVGLLWHLL